MAGVVVVEETKVTVVDERLKNVRWGWYVVLGIISIIFGGLVLFYPKISTAFMVILIAVLLVLFGLFGIVSGLMQPKGQKLAPILLGIIGLLVGVAGVAYPQAFGLSLVVIMGILILILGGLMITLSIVEKEYPHRWALFFAGVISVIFAVAFFAYPMYAGILVFSILLGIYFIINGILSIVVGFKVRSLKKLAFGTSKTP